MWYCLQISGQSWGENKKLIKYTFVNVYRACNIKKLIRVFNCEWVIKDTTGMKHSLMVTTEDWEGQKETEKQTTVSSVCLFVLSLNLYHPVSPSMCLSAVSQSLKQSVSKAVSRFVPVWLKHYLRGFATLFLKRSDILSQPPLLPTGKLKMPQSPQATRFIYLHTYWVREAETDRERRRGRSERALRRRFEFSLAYAKQVLIQICMICKFFVTFKKNKK